MRAASAPGSARGVAASILVIVVAAVCVRLGFWQLDRLEQRRARNAALASATSLPALELRDSFAAVSAEPQRFLNRRVVVSGRYPPGDAFVLRGRTDGGNPGVHLVSPLLLGLPLTASQDTVIPLDISVSFSELPRLAQMIPTALNRGTVAYQLDGMVGVDAGLLGRPSFGPMTLLQGSIQTRR